MFSKFLEANQLKRLIQFNAGLHKDYDGAKTNLLSMDHLLTVNKAYHIMLQIEKQNSLTNLHGNPSETSAFMSMSSRFNTFQPKFQSHEKDFKDFKKTKVDRFCDFCKMKGHTKEICFKLVEYPDWYNDLKAKKISKVGS